jgi:hypothetical protein
MVWAETSKRSPALDPRPGPGGVGACVGARAGPTTSCRPPLHILLTHDWRLVLAYSAPPLPPFFFSLPSFLIGDAYSTRPQPVREGFGAENPNRLRPPPLLRSPPPPAFRRADRYGPLAFSPSATRSSRSLSSRAHCISSPSRRDVGVCFLIWLIRVWTVWQGW